MRAERLFRCRPATTAMQPIIGQNPKPLAFPDLRNLGAILRILVGANLLFAVGALVHVSRWDDWPEALLDLIAVAEPHLLAQVTVLALIAPWLTRHSYATGVTVVLTLTVLIGAGVDVLLHRLMPTPGGSPARGLVFSLIVAGTLLFYLHLRAKALSPAITEARLQALQARIRPHFLFNSLNAVLSLIRADPRRAEAALEDMADLFRVLMRDNRDLVPLGDEVELCRQYLALESLRLGDRLRVEWHTTSMPADALVPPLVLQPLVENAVYHGIEPRSKPGTISINIFARDGEVHTILRNPYRPDNDLHRAGNKMAFANVRERLALHFDVEASLDATARGDSYEVHIRVPYRPAPGRAAAGRGAAAASGGRPAERGRRP